jgi:hypothetical protein
MALEQPDHKSTPHDLSISDLSASLFDSAYAKHAKTEAAPLVQEAESTLERTRRMGTPHEQAMRNGSPSEQARRNGTPNEQARCKSLGGTYNGSTTHSLDCSK